MKTYRSHKMVEAAKIVAAELTPNGWKLALDDGAGSLVELDGEKTERFRPTEDDLGYLVIYNDGYVSWSPSKAFEEGYAEISEEVEIENRIKDKGLDAPRITPQMVDDEIVSSSFTVFEDTCLTVCCLVLRNGYTVTGESACASIENFDREIGQDIAFKDARQKIWALLGFRLKDQLAGMV